MFQNVFIVIKTNWVAIIGAVTGIVGLVLSVLNYLRDRVVIKVEYKKEWELIGKHEFYKEKELYSELRIINRGRRPVKIEKVGARVDHEKGWINIIDPYWFHKTNRLFITISESNFFQNSFPLSPPPPNAICR